MITPIKLPREQKDQIISSLQHYFETERSETIGSLGAEQIVDLLLKQLSPYIYNKAIEDTRKVLLERMASLEEELYALERPVSK